MNNAFRRTAFSLLLFPVVLIGIILVIFGYYSVSAYWRLDDWTFRDHLENAGIIDTGLYFYETANGRLASHLFLCSIIKMLMGIEPLLFLYRFIMLFVFIISLGHLLRNYLSAFRQKTISLSKSLFFATFITAFLFFFFYYGNFEVWFWVSSTGVYLISLILAMNGFALLLSEKQSTGKIFLATVAFFLAGGFSESFAVMYVLMLLYFGYNITKKHPFFLRRRWTLVFSLIAIIGALLINIFSGGAQGRLELLGDFRFLYAIKNTLHSLAFPILRYNYLWISIGITICLFLYANIHFPIRFILKHFAIKSFTMLLFIAISFFIPCYLLSDIVPDRAASLGYLAGVLFLFDYFIFRSDSFGRQV